MEPLQAHDTWEEKTRARYKEGAESHRLYAIAADPKTPAHALEAVADDALRNFNSRSDFTTDVCLVVLEALAANPNTPPHLFAELIWRSPFSCRAFCHNPITPFLLLEQPHFVAGLMEQAQHALLRDADAPPLFVQMLAQGNAAQNEAVRTAARLHVAFAGEAQTRDEWETQLRDYWRAECAATPNTIERQWHIDLAEIGLAPSWAEGISPVPEPRPPSSVSSFPLVKEWLQFKCSVGSAKEATLLKGIGPKVENREVLARGLRANATPSDLQSLLHTPGSGIGWVKEAILRHPAVTGAIISEIMEDGADVRIVVSLPQTPPNVLVDVLQNSDPYIRRLARRHPNAPPRARAISRRAFYHSAAQMVDRHFNAPFVSFVACLCAPHKRNNLPQKAEHHHWTERLEAVFLADASDEANPGDPEQRTGRDLLVHLSRDGNRIVRAAAQTRLAAPNYRFSLASPDEPAIPTP